MLPLRKSIANTRKFFHKTLGSLKSLFSGGSYQKLPKSPLHDSNSLHINMNRNIPQTKDSDKASTRIKPPQHSASAKINSLSAAKKTEINMERRDQGYPINSNTMVVINIVKNTTEEEEEEERIPSRSSNNNKLALVEIEKKLKELQLLDVSNVDHVLDIEEVLHYYSRLTCPAYLEILDKFFMEIFADVFG